MKTTEFSKLPEAEQVKQTIVRAKELAAKIHENEDLEKDMTAMSIALKRFLMDKMEEEGTIDGGKLISVVLSIVAKFELDGLIKIKF